MKSSFEKRATFMQKLVLKRQMQGRRRRFSAPAFWRSGYVWKRDKE